MRGRMNDALAFVINRRPILRAELNTNVGTDINMFIVGNKTDLVTKRRVDRTGAAQYAAEIGAQYTETSAKTNDGIEELFLAIAQQLVAQATHQDYEPTGQVTTITGDDFKNDPGAGGGCNC